MCSVQMWTCVYFNLSRAEVTGGPRLSDRAVAENLQPCFISRGQSGVGDARARSPLRPSCDQVQVVNEQLQRAVVEISDHV